MSANTPKPPAEEPLYRPLDRAKNEIRLLRILPSFELAGSTRSLKPASDIVVCKLEHASMDEMQKLKENRAAMGNFMDSMMLKMFGLDTNDGDDPDQAESHAAQRQIMQSLMGGVGEIDSKTTFSIGDERLKVLEKMYAESMARMLRWLPPYFESLTVHLTFERWLQSWIWSPLSGNANHADKPSATYYALSYVWADSKIPLHDPDVHHVLKFAEAGGISAKDLVSNACPAKMRQIILNDEPVDVGENLYEALRTLREIPEIQNGTRLWVDSLCIDQTNITERSEEVKRMDEIYSKADRVVTYLGASDHYSDDVLQLMEGLGNGIRSEQAANLLEHWFRTGSQSEFFHYLARLLSRDYWSRIWIMQEIALASEKSIVICGMKRFSMIDVLLFGRRHAMASAELSLRNRRQPVGIEIFKDGRNQDQPVMSLGKVMDGIAKLKNIYELRLLLNRNKVGLENFNTLWFRTASENRATDPRDLIYGMLAVLPSQLVAKIKVDYSPSNTYQKVMTDFAVAHFDLFDSLHWLLFRPWFEFPDCENWPSWVPNLGLPFSSAHFWWTLGNGWKAWDGLDKTITTFRIEGSRLHCRGFHFDTIRSHTTPAIKDPGLDNELWEVMPSFLDALANRPEVVDMDQFHKLWEPIIAPIPKEPERTTNTASIQSSDASAIQGHRYKNKNGLKAALSACFARLNLSPEDSDTDIFSIPYNAIKTAMLHQALGGNHGYSSYTSGVGVALRYLWRVVLQAGSLDLWGIRLRDLFAAAPDEDYVDFPDFTLPDRTSQLASFFTTASGYVGVALCELQAGDGIYIVKGCAMPLVLRPTDNAKCAFKVLGGVYVHGAMGGEGVTDFLASAKSVSEIVLC